MMDEVPKIFEAVFECTLQMITVNFEDYPDHRLKFFALLRAITNHCFRALFTLDPSQLKLVVDSIVWAFRHTERNIAETGLNLLLEMTKFFQVSEFCNQFHQSFYLSLVQEIFAVMTDGFHKPGFKLHALLLQNLFTIAEWISSPPLWTSPRRDQRIPSNTAFVKEHVSNLLTSSFPNMGPAGTRFWCRACSTQEGSDAVQEPPRFPRADEAVQVLGQQRHVREEQAARQAAERQRIEAIPACPAEPDRHERRLIDRVSTRWVGDVLNLGSASLAQLADSRVLAERELEAVQKCMSLENYAELHRSHLGRRLRVLRGGGTETSYFRMSSAAASAYVSSSVSGNIRNSAASSSLPPLTPPACAVS